MPYVFIQQMLFEYLLCVIVREPFSSCNGVKVNPPTVVGSRLHWFVLVV